ncbi:MAG: SMC-Scp complex subunit ScpB [Gammaproteobacteria bacterium HGW-Gammaproteobacteria-8]|nr:MAG: SMC-Scp complex subunit ScpB [Gammaproteobacteria bacterium HGW-Gammaproteobacteria-8]
MELQQLKNWIEGALLAAGQPLSLNQLNSLFDEDSQPGHGAIREAVAMLDAELEGRACELVEVAGGYRLQIRASIMPVVSRLWAEKPPRYSRALLETLAIIAYRQPITRGEIEQIRGVSLSANILKTLQEREWIRVVGQRDVPGRPELLGTTRAFLDYFGLKGLDDLPTLAEIRDLENLEPELDFKTRATHEDPDHEQAVETGEHRSESENDQEQATDPGPDRVEPDEIRSEASSRQRDPDDHPASDKQAADEADTDSPGPTDDAHVRSPD